mmetsp:Transcript_2059/g.4695  ORF Transcript_2059/g.4695 Transcript_2059/m.4695 type:complete len:233 (+) Transcript_2059:279-977(+)
MASATGKTSRTLATSPAQTEAPSQEPMFHSSTARNACQSGLGTVSTRFLDSNSQPVMVVPLNTPVNAMKMITAKGVRSKHMKRIDPCPTCAIPARLSAASAATKRICTVHDAAGCIPSKSSACPRYATKSPGYSAASTAPDTNCSHPAISPKKSPNAARTHNVKPPFSGKAVDSSAVIIAVGIDQRMPTIKIPRMALNGPAVCTIVSVPSGPPAIAKYVSATSDHSVTVLGT